MSFGFLFSLGGRIGVWVFFCFFVLFVLFFSSSPLLTSNYAPIEIDQNKDRMLEILEGKGLSFLFPLMKLEKELLKQIKVDPSPQSIYKWIKDNISPKLHTDRGFVNILMTRYSSGPYL